MSTIWSCPVATAAAHFAVTDTVILLEPDQPRVRTFEKLQRDDAEQTLQPAVTAKKKKSIDIQLDRVSFVCFFFLLQNNQQDNSFTWR